MAHRAKPTAGIRRKTHGTRVALFSPGMRASFLLARLSPCAPFVLAFVVAGVEACSSGAAPDNPDGACVDIEPAPADLACVEDDDCAAVVTGVACASDVASSLCAYGAANSAGAAKLTAQLLSVAKGVSTPTGFCDISAGRLLCFAGHCIQCGDGYQPSTCPVTDGGVAPADGNVVTSDGGSAGVDGRAP